MTLESCTTTCSSDAPPKKMPKFQAKFNLIEIQPLLDSKLTDENVPLYPFYILSLLDRRIIGSLLKLLPIIPEEFSHLKRVDKSGRVLIQPVSIPISVDLLLKFKELGLTDEFVEECSVPAVKPVTRRQFNWSKAFWSTSFHPNDEVERLISSSYFDGSGLEYVSRWCERADTVGCVVVQDGSELAVGSLSRSLLGHSVMNLVESLSSAERQGVEYLANDCDVFLKAEPCAMCAMALVHARANRVFFIRRSTNGVLTSGCWQLHLEPVLNHHYKAFHVMFDGITEVTTCGR